MTSKPKKLIVILVILVILFLVYFFFIKKPPTQEANLVSSNPIVQSAGMIPQNPTLAENFLSDLLNVKSIKLDDSIFSDPAFSILVDSTIVLIPDGTEGRPNPFAPIGSDIIVVSSPSPVPLVSPTTTPSITPPPATSTPTTPPPAKPAN